MARSPELLALFFCRPLWTDNLLAKRQRAERLGAMTVRAWLANLHRAGEVTPTTIAKAFRLLRRIST